MRAFSPRRLAVLTAAAFGLVAAPALSGCASSRPDDDWARQGDRPAKTADAPSDTTAGPARKT